MNASTRIIIADDEPDVREYLCRLLPRLGHAVVAAAANGLELIELCTQHVPDLVIADLRMPEMNGEDALRSICQTRTTPFILMSAYLPPQRHVDLAHVPSLYLEKPVNKRELSQAIEWVMGFVRKAAGSEGW